MRDIKKIANLFLLIFLVSASSSCFASSFSLDRSIGILPGIYGAGSLIKELDLPPPGEGRSNSQKSLNTQLSGGKEGSDDRPNQSGSSRQYTSNQNRGEDNRSKQEQESQPVPNDMGNSGDDGNRNPEDDKNSKIFSEDSEENIPEELYKSVYITKEDLLLICKLASVDIKTLKELYQSNQEKYKILVNLIALEVYKSNEGVTFDKLNELYDDKIALTDLADNTTQPRSLVIWSRFAINFNELFEVEPSDILLTNEQKNGLEYSTIPAKIGAEKDSCDYVFVDPENFVHVLCPLVGGETAGLDNTCQTLSEITRFFHGETNKNNSIIDVLNRYKNDLEKDIRSIRLSIGNNNLLLSKKDRLAQIKKYLSLLSSYQEPNLGKRFPKYPPEVENLLREKTNCVSVHLSPVVIDSILRTSSGSIFRAKRRQNNVSELQASETPLLYSLITLFRDEKLSSKLAGMDIKNKILDEVEKELGSDEQDINDKSTSEIIIFLDKSIKEAVNNTLTENINLDVASTGDKITAGYLSDIMLSDKDTPKEIARNILSSALNENFWSNLSNQLILAARGNNYSINENSSVPNKLSIAIQFFLAEINLFCHFNNLSKKDFGAKLDTDDLLRTKLISAIEEAINNGRSIENRLIDFVNDNEQSFGLKDKISKYEANKIINRFNLEYQLVKESPHMDDFLFFSREKPGIFVVHKNRISFNALNLLDPAKDEFIPEHLMQFNELNTPILPHKNNLDIKAVKYGDLVNYLKSLDKENFALILAKMVNQYYDIDLIRALLALYFVDEPMRTLSKKIEELTSKDTMKAYKAGAKFDTLSKIYDKNKYKFNKLTSFETRETYKAGAKFDTLNKLYDKNKYKFNALTSNGAREAYKARYVTFKDLKDFDAKKIAALTSRDAKAIYKARYATFKDLKDFDAEKIEALTSDKVITAYKAEAKFEVLNKLYDENMDKFKTLISNGAIEAYKAGAKFEILSDMYDEDNNKFKVLTSQDAIGAYKAGHVTFYNLEYFDVEKISALTSRDAKVAYAARYVTFEDLQDFDTETIKDLTSLDDKNKINVLTSHNARKAYKKGYITFNGLKDFNVEKINALTSWNTIKSYAEEYVTFNNLKDFDAKKIRALTDQLTISAYAAGITFDVLNRMYDDNNDKFKTLTFSYAMAAYKAGATFEVLSKLYDDNKVKFNVLTSWNAIEAYKAEVKFEVLSKLYDENNNKFKALTSNGTILAYEAGANFSALSRLYDEDNNKFKILTSKSAIAAYKARHVNNKAKYVTFNDLKDLNVEKIKVLIYEEVITAYESGYVTFNDLRDLEVEKIEALTSGRAIDVMHKNNISLSKLSILYDSIKYGEKFTKALNIFDRWISYKYDLMDKLNLRYKFDKANFDQAFKLCLYLNGLDDNIQNTYLLCAITKIKPKQMLKILGNPKRSWWNLGRFFGFGDNGLNNLEKYKLLVSDKALEIYEKYGFEIKDLIVVDDPKYLKFLLDEWIEKEFAIDQGESLKEVLELSPSLINGYFLLHCDF